MNDHDNLQLRDPNVIPTSEILEKILGDSYAAYVEFQDEISGFEMEQEWQWYKPYKAWFAKGQYFWTTSRGTRKEKNLYWLYIYEGYFSVAVWFKEKNRKELMDVNVSNKTKKLICDAETMGKLLTFPVVLDIKTSEPLADIYLLLESKKKLEL